MKLSLYLPGLLTPKAEGESLHPITQAQLPALVRLLARAGSAPCAEPLAALTGQARLPAASLGALAHGLREDGYWLRADPVDLMADHRGIYLLGNESLGLNPAEAGDLVAELNDFLAQDGLVLHAATPHEWYLWSPQPIALETTPLSEVLGRDVSRFQPQGPDSRRWQRLNTELSMLLHSARSNQARNECRRKPVAGLWLWGEGERPARAQLSCELLYTDEPALSGYAQIARVAPEAVPAAYTELSSTGSIAVWAGELDRLMRHGDVPGWLEAVSRWHAAWFAPALAALRAGGLRELALYPGNGRVHVLRRGDLKKFWRWDQSLTRYL